MKAKLVNTEFLPAVLEVQQTPPSKVSRIIIYVILALIISAIIWAAYSRIDVVAVARGQLTVSGLARPIHPLVSAEITSINVEEGQYVGKDQVLVALDDRKIISQIQEIELRKKSLETKRQRYQAVMTVYQAEKLTPEVIKTAKQSINDKTSRYHATIDINRFQSVMKKYDGLILKERSEIKIKKSNLKSLSSTLPLINQQLSSLEILERKRMLSSYNYIDLKKEVVKVQYDVESLKDRVASSLINIVTINNEKSLFLSDLILKSNEVIIEFDEQLLITNKELEQLYLELEKYTIRSPVSGYVQDLLYRDKSAMAIEGQSLLVIVPDNEKVLAEVMILNKDIGFIENNNDVAIKLDAFDFSRYGKLNGQVKNISAGAIQDERLGLVYRAIINISEDEITADGKVRQLEPGMSLTAEIKLGRRTVMSYLLSTINTEVDNAGKQK
ncbi:HlyD family type I secretion periplasmic adaptor subunit [Aliivibrio kagoshimensis]|uniref:HlyD family type I secretion periplasmic adaptor subunit n=1 Tax=Aliivibrio kagoshimensis TaxID=2910230 RepID=UPI003D115807